MCGSGDQTRLDALYDGDKTRPRGRHDKRLAIGGRGVQGQRDRGHPGHLPQSVFDAGFRSRGDARNVATVWIPKCQLVAHSDYIQFLHAADTYTARQFTLPVISI